MDTKSKGFLIVISGFSGSGKGTIVNGLLEKYPEDYAVSVSATTRDPRPGEVHGKQYFFLKREEFETMIEKNELVEYATYVNNYYGTPKAYVEQQLQQGKNVILEIEIQGALKIREQFSNAILLFVTPPSAEELKRRLEGRGTEDAATISARLNRAVQESEGMKDYDYLVINDVLEECIEDIHKIICSESFRIEKNAAFIEKMRTEIQEFKEGE